MILIEQLKLYFAKSPTALRHALEIASKHTELISVDEVVEKMKAERPKQQISFGLKKFTVDRVAGKLSNLALITAGREAKGHGIYIDNKTLASGLASIEEKGGKLKAFIAHPTWSEYFEGTERLMTM
ncbi:hypothetical protein RZS08_30120, partial [Arthrospira platensis SPKY1]|nr:hypothetical protein [Arthrospira platensis SPKY1]